MVPIQILMALASGLSAVFPPPGDILCATLRFENKTKRKLRDPSLKERSFPGRRALECVRGRVPVLDPLLMGAMVWKEQKRMKDQLEAQKSTLTRLAAKMGVFPTKLEKAFQFQINVEPDPNYSSFHLQVRKLHFATVPGHRPEHGHASGLQGSRCAKIPRRTPVPGHRDPNQDRARGSQTRLQLALLRRGFRAAGRLGCCAAKGCGRLRS